MMEMSKLLLRCLAVVGTMAATAVETPVLRSSRVLANIDEPPSDVFACRILLFDIMAEQETEFFMCNPVRDGEISSQRYPIDLPHEIAALHHQMVRSTSALDQLGDFYVGIPYGYIDPVDLSIVIPDPEAVTVLETNQRRHLGRRQVTSTGTYTALVLRIVDKVGRASIHSFDELYEAIFDTVGVSVHSQYKACSWDQFAMVPAGGIGVLEVEVDRDSSDGDDRKLTQAAEAEALKVLNIDNLFDYTDFILYVTPPMGTWIAYASVGGGYSVYNSMWGGYMGSLMHEVGHNLGLLHANEGTLGSDSAKYQDFSGYMSGAKASYMRFDYPVQCFNGANHWELGWYNQLGHAKEVNPNTPEIVYVGAFADSDKFSNMAGFQEYAVVKSGDYYIHYNRKSGINKDTNEAADQLTITQQWDDGTYAVGDISNTPGTTWTLSGTDWTLKICDRAVGSGSYADVLTVWMGNGTPDCGEDGNSGAAVDGDGPGEESVCKYNMESCNSDNDCCSQRCQPTRSGQRCLPNPSEHETKNRFRISRDERPHGRRTRSVRGSRGVHYRR